MKDRLADDGAAVFLGVAVIVGMGVGSLYNLGMALSDFWRSRSWRR